MNQLVFIENQQVVTDSLTIAEMFQKGHDDVLKDIRKQMDYAGVDFSLGNFSESTYRNLRGREYPKFNLTEEAFTLVVFSYNTKEAVQTKIKFIHEFKRMREFIESQQQKKFTAREQLQLIMQANEETAQRVDLIEGTVSEVKAEVEGLKDELYIVSIQAKAIRNKVGEKVYDALGGKESNAFKHLKNKLFTACWRDFKNYFEINEYRELPRVKFELGMKFLFAWQPSTELRLEIEHYNSQMQLKLVK